MTMKDNPVHSKPAPGQSPVNNEHIRKNQSSFVITGLLEKFQSTEKDSLPTESGLRATKLKILKRRIQSGTYRPEPEQIAEALLRFLRRRK